MKKFDSLGKLRDRMTSNTHEPEPTEEADDDRASGAADGVGDASEGVPNTRAAATDRMKAGSRMVTGFASAVRRSASNKASSVTTGTVDGATTVSRKVVDAAASVGQDASGKGADVTAVAAKRVRAGARSALDATASVAGQLMAATPTLLASSLSKDLNNLLEGMVKGSATIYDKAMDANYLDPLLKPDLGGSYHRLFDGGHTISGAISAARDASPDDNIIQEALGTLQGLLRDGTTIRGLPLANWDKGTFDGVAGALESTFHIPKGWFYDLNTYDAAELLGATVGAVALAELHGLMLGRGAFEGDEREMEELVFDTFVKHVPTERMEVFLDLYRRLHGGPYADPGVDLSDDHGDEAAAATEIAVGEVAEGSLDYHFDFDYFKFRAEEGQRYVISVNHQTLRPSSLLLYGPDGQTRARYLDRARVSAGPQMRWIAPASGDYYFAVQNFSGESGPYTTTITSVPTVMDDHGDSAAATDISVGEIVEGTIDHSFDFDFFRVQALAGQKHRFSTQGVTLGFSRVDLYESDGVTWMEQSAEAFLNEEEQGENPVWSGGDGVWVTPSSGEYYLAAQGVYGSVGTYRLIVSEYDSDRVD